MGAGVVQVYRCIGVLQEYRCTAVDQLRSGISIVRVCIGTGVVQRYIVCRNSTEVYRSCTRVHRYRRCTLVV
jgi:hypothetical protein